MGEPEADENLLTDTAPVKGGQSRRRLTVAEWFLIVLSASIVVCVSYLVFDLFVPKPLTKTLIPSIKRDLGLEVRREKLLSYEQTRFKDGEPRAVWAEFDVSGQDTRWREKFEWIESEPGLRANLYPELREAKGDFTLVRSGQYNFALYYIEGKERTFLFIDRYSQ